jgi:hypothetical protein
LWVDGAARNMIEAPKLDPWIVRYELSDFEWAAIKPFLPNKSRGVRRVRNVMSDAANPPVVGVQSNSKLWAAR